MNEKKKRSFREGREGMVSRTRLVSIGEREQKGGTKEGSLPRLSAEQDGVKGTGHRVTSKGSFCGLKSVRFFGGYGTGPRNGGSRNRQIRPVEH